MSSWYVSDMYTQLSYPKARKMLLVSEPYSTNDTLLPCRTLLRRDVVVPLSVLFGKVLLVPLAGTVALCVPLKQSFKTLGESKLLWNRG